MLDRRTTLVYIVAVAAVTGSAWITFVPDWLSGSTFGSILAVAIAVVVVSTIAVRSIGPSPAVAQVLYEAEHPTVLSAQRPGHDRTANDAP
jgi:hypothetical protein